MVYSIENGAVSSFFLNFSQFFYPTLFVYIYFPPESGFVPAHKRRQGAMHAIVQRDALDVLKVVTSPVVLDSKNFIS